MYLSLDELVQWIGITVFEIWINLVSLLAFLIILTLKLDTGYLSNYISIPTLTWWNVFTPLFIADALNAYFCVIILIRMHFNGSYKTAFLRATWSTLFLTFYFLFKLLLCRKVTGYSQLTYTEVVCPIFVLFQLIAVRACQLPNM